MLQSTIIADGRGREDVILGDCSLQWGFVSCHNNKYEKLDFVEKQV